jgi:hypothetical protein
MTFPSWNEHKKRYLALLGGFLINIMMGTAYLWGLINEYLTSYFRLHGNVTLKEEDAIIVNPIMITTFVLLSTFSIPLSLKVKKK